MTATLSRSDSDLPLIHLIGLHDDPASVAERPQRPSALAPQHRSLGDALLTTKFFMPRPRHALVHRGRLIERLSEALRGPLTLIVAPAGYGKTTLLGAWCAARRDGGVPIAWLALDAGDDDLPRFLRYLVAALQRTSPTVGGTTLAALRSPQLPPLDALLTPLLNDLAVLPDDLFLILDDYHLIQSPAIHRTVAFLLEHLPPRVHVVLATRADPPLPLARLRARGQLGEFRAADLRFTAEEIGSFLSGTMGLDLPAEMVARLEHCTEGWVAALQLAALALQRSDPASLADTIALSTRANRHILEYLADEVFNLQPEPIRRFLLHTAVLERLTGDLCDALVGDSDGSAVRDGMEMLEQLEAANLFLVPVDGARTWYRYHQLFAGFLRQRLRREYPEIIPELHRRAARWLEQQGLHTEAADHALAGADPAWAARLIEQAIPEMIWQRGEMATLLRWLEQLPREAVRTRPRLCLDLAWVLLWSAQVEAIEPRLQDAERALDAAGTPVEDDLDPLHRALFGEIAAIRAELARQRGELAAAIDLARRALADLPADERRVRGVTTGLLAGAYRSLGDAASASRAYANVVAVSSVPETITLALIAAGRLVLTEAWEGRLHRAAETYRQTLELAATYGMYAAPPIGVAQVGMGEVLLARNDFDAADQLLRDGIARCVASGSLAEMALDGFLILARVAQARGDSEGVVAALRQAEAVGREGSVAQYAERVDVTRAWLWLTAAASPDLGAAARWSRGRERTWAAGEPIGHVGLLERLTLARLRLAEGRLDEAGALLRQLFVDAEAGGLVGCQIEIFALQARLHAERDQPAQAMVALTRALTLAEPEGYIRPFVDEGAPMVTLLRQAQRRGAAAVFVDTLLAACGAAHPTAAPAVAATALVEPISARERELLQLLAAGLSTAEIATQLFITVGTVRNHLKSIFGKLDAHSRLQAVERARALGLL